MNIEEKKNKLIEARNKLSEVFNDSKDNWNDNYWCSNICFAMGYLDTAIRTIGTKKKILVGEKC